MFKKNLEIILEASPDILNHNVETVRRLQKEVRVQAKYDRSLHILEWAKNAGFITKSGIMVGLGETEDELIELFDDLAPLDILTIGQYLQPTKAHAPIARYYTPDEFEMFRQRGEEMGFKWIESAPLVRSSYHAEDQVDCLDKDE